LKIRGYFLIIGEIEYRREHDYEMG
jgi:hypothetical protein